MCWALVGAARGTTACSVAGTNVAAISVGSVIASFGAVVAVPAGALAIAFASGVAGATVPPSTVLVCVVAVVAAAVAIAVSTTAALGVDGGARGGVARAVLGAGSTRGGWFQFRLSGARGGGGLLLCQNC